MGNVRSSPSFPMMFLTTILNLKESPLLHSLEILYPIRFPCLTTIGRIRLLPMTRGGCNLGPDETYSDWFSVFGIVRVEGTYSILKAPSHGRIHGRERYSTVKPPDRPLARLCVERSGGHAAVSAGWHLEHVVVDISVTTHQWLTE